MAAGEGIEFNKDDLSYQYEEGDNSKHLASSLAPGLWRG